MASVGPFPAPISEVEAWDIDPYAPEILINLEPWYRELRRRGPLVWLSRYGCWATGAYTEVANGF